MITKTLITGIMITPLFAGDLNIVNLGPAEGVRVEISSAGAAQEVEIAHGAATGQFRLPEQQSATVRVVDGETGALTIPAGGQAHIAVLSPTKNGYRWSLILGQPKEGKWATRVINLTGQPITCEGPEGPVELLPDQPAKLSANEKPVVKLSGTENGRFTYEGSEPCAVLAIVYLKDDAPRVVFVTDR